MSMGHDHIEQRLTDLVTGGLADGEKNEVQEHLDSCPLCRERLASLRKTIAVLEQSRHSKVPEGYFGTILPRLRQRIDRPGGLRSLLDFRWPHLAAPIGAAILVTGLLTAIPSANQGTRNLAAATRGLEAGDLADVYFDELQITPLATTPPEDLAKGAVSGLDLSKGLLEVMLDENVMQELKTVDELDEEEVEIILRRLETRTLL